MGHLKYSAIGKHMPKGVVPSKTDIPQWYKDIRVVNTENLTFDDKNFKITSPKNCVPYLEAMTFGYLATLWTDIYITNEHMLGSRRKQQY